MYYAIFDAWGNPRGYVDENGLPQYLPNAVPPGVISGGITNYANQPNSGAFTNSYGLNNTATALTDLASQHQTLLGTQQLIATGTGSDPSAQNPVNTIRKPWLDAPDGSVPFDYETVAALPAIGASAVVVSFTVPDGYDGVINAYSWNFTGGGFTEGSGDLQAQVLNNGAPVRNYDNILVEKGSTAIPRPIAPLRIYSGRTYSLIINHIANNLLTGNIVGSFVGYFYPALS